MKKFVLIVLSMLLCFSLAGCIVVDTPTKGSGSGESSTPAKTETTFGLNETAVFKNLQFTALEFEESEGENFFVPDEGNVFIGIKFEIKNISNKEQSVSTILLFEGYADDVKCSYSISAACAFSEGSLDGTIAPGKKLVGWYALEVPKNWQEIELEIASDWLSNNKATFIFEK